MHASDDILKVLVGNKADMEQRKVTHAEGAALARGMETKFFETSAKTGANI